MVPFLEYAARVVLMRNQTIGLPPLLPEPDFSAPPAIYDEIYAVTPGTPELEDINGAIPENQQVNQESPAPVEPDHVIDSLWAILKDPKFSLGDLPSLSQLAPPNIPRPVLREVVTPSGPLHHHTPMELLKILSGIPEVVFSFHLSKHRFHLLALLCHPLSLERRSSLR